MYRVINAVLGLAADVFYQREHLGGTLPLDGPLVVVGNHPNALVDPVLVQRVAGRRLRLLAKAPIFQMPVLGWIVRSLGVLPVYRAQDGFDATGANTDMFAAVHDALKGGAAIALFPEGISHDEPALQPLKTGAARMALGAEAQANWTLGVRVVPVGLVYQDKAIFRSAVGIAIGEPIPVASYQAAHADDPRAAVRVLTGDIDHALREVTVNLEQWEDLPLIRFAGALWDAQSAETVSDTGTVQALAAGMGALRKMQPARVLALRVRVAALSAQLEALGLHPGALGQPVHPAIALRFVLRNAIALGVGAPIALLGVIAYALPYNAVRVLVRRVGPQDRDVTATKKVLAGLMIYPLWHLGVVIGLTLMAGRFAVPTAIVASVGLPGCGLYAERFIARRRVAWAALKTAVFSVTERARSAALSRERDTILTEIDALARLLPAVGSPD